MYPVDFFWRAVNRYPKHTAVVHPTGTLDYATLGQMVRQRAAGLMALDPAMGSFVCLGAANDVDHLISILAILASDKIWVPLNPRNGDPELRRIVEFVEPTLVVLDEMMNSRLQLSGEPVYLASAVDAAAAGSAGMTGAPRGISRPLDATQALKFTGGTTGIPKGVQQPLRAWNSNIVTQLHELSLRPTDRYLVVAPLTHGTSTYMLPFLAVGAAIVFPEGNKPDDLLRAAASHAASVVFAPPTVILGMAAAQRHASYDLSALRYVIYGGAPMRTDQIRAVQSVFGPVVCTTYGQTEAPQICTFLPPSELSGADLLSVGRPTLLTEVAIVDPQGEVLPPGDQGEIAIRGDLVMTGYFRAEEESRKVLLQGWLRTGDIGVLDERGYLFIRDRLRDVIITGGFNVYPADVEAALASHPAISDCSVVGIPSEKWGEAVHAAVEVRAGLQYEPDDVRSFVRQRLGPVKTPKELHRFDALPRSPVGKVLKPAIRAEIMRRADVRDAVSPQPSSTAVAGGSES